MSSNSKNVKVLVRTRPTSKASHNITIDSSSITVNTPQPGVTKTDNTQTVFNMPILNNVTQEKAYNDAARDIVREVIKGVNGTIMAYGQTGAGKTFTMSGSLGDFKQRGINTRAVGEVFRHIGEHPENRTTVMVSYLEIYQEQFRDLLGKGNDLQIQANHGKVNVKGLTKKLVNNEQEALEILFEGEAIRTRKAHKMNPNSTRSHCVFTIYLETRSLIESTDKVIGSKLHLVDLAGSERVGKTGSTGETLQEAQYINKSLTFLEQVVIALSSKSRDHIPFRQSKLTHLLSDSLGGNCQTRLIANISGEQQHLSETLSTLRFAQRMSKVTNQASVNVRYDPVQLVKKYEREIKELKQELVMHDTLSNRTGVTYEPYTPEEQTQLRGVVSEYVRGETADIAVVNLRQIKEVFKQFKNIILDQRSRQGGGGPAVGLGSETLGGGASGAGGGASVDAVQGGGDTYVGDINDSQSGFPVGVTDDNARPNAMSASMDLGNAPVVAEMKESVTLPPKHATPPDEGAAFEEYKQQHSTGVELNETYNVAKKELREHKAKLRDISAQVNKSQNLISANKQKLEELRRKNGPTTQNNGVQVIDEEEFAMIKSDKALKATYHELFKKRTEINKVFTDKKGRVETFKMDLCNNFLNWYMETYPRSQEEIQNEELDEGEKFDKLEKANMNEQELSFHNATKNFRKRTTR